MRRPWTVAGWSVFVASALLAVFLAPQYVAVPPSVSDSYLFGYSNRTGILILVLCLVVGGSFSKQLSLKFREAERGEPIPQRIMGWWMIVFASGGGAMYCAVRGMQGHAESIYFIDRVKMLARGGKIYQDFEFAYGALFLYGPRILMGFRLNAEQSYFLFWLLCLVGGVWILALTLNMLDYPCERKVEIFHLLCLTSLFALLTTGLNYTLLRFIPASYFGLLVQRMDGRGGRRHRMLAMLLSVGFMVVLLTISPEMALAYGAGTLGYFAVFGRWDWRSAAAYGGLLGAEAAVAFWANKLNVFATLKVFAGGAYSFPILPAGHILLFFFACGLVSVFVAARLYEGSRGDGMLMVAAVSAGTLFAALGRCDPGHVLFAAIGILLVATVLASNFHGIWRGYKIAFLVFFVVIPSVYALSEIPFVLHQRIALIHDAASIDRCPAPSEVKDTVLSPFGYRSSCVLGIRSGVVDTGYFYGLDNVFTPTTVQRKISEMRNHPEEGLLLPENFGDKCKVDAVAERTVIRILFVYPYRGREVKNPDSVAEPLCAYINRHYRRTGGAGKRREGLRICDLELRWAIPSPKHTERPQSGRLQIQMEAYTTGPLQQLLDQRPFPAMEMERIPCESIPDRIFGQLFAYAFAYCSNSGRSIEQFHSYCALAKAVQCGFPWEKTARRSYASGFTYCGTALGLVWIVFTLPLHEPGAILGPHNPIVGHEIRLDDPFVRARQLHGSKSTLCTSSSSAVSHNTYRTRRWSKILSTSWKSEALL